MTEEEARQKWCPFVRIEAGSYEQGQVAINGVNRFGTAEPSRADGLCCIASACMAWRWDEGREVGTDIKCEHCGGDYTRGGEECPHCVTGYEVQVVPTGYCGLAGKP